jgi:uncharacterized protein (DUF1501 family)
LGVPGTQLLPSFVSLNTNTGSHPGPGYFAPQHGPFFINPNGGGLGNSTHRDGAAAFARRYALLVEMDAERRSSPSEPAYAEMAQMNLSARKLMYNDDVNRIFTFDQEQKNAYGNTTFGNSCIAARNMLKANTGVRFIQLTIGSWDHHANIYTPNATLQNLSRQFDNGLGALIADLKNEGLFDQTLIVAMGEFGRTVGAPNSQTGRDHFLQQAVLMAGAGIRGNRAIGATDPEGRTIAEAGWSRNREIRAEDIEATIYSALGIDWTTIRRDDPTGRGFEYVPFSSDDLYGPIHELWS